MFVFNEDFLFMLYIYESVYFCVKRYLECFGLNSEDAMDRQHRSSASESQLIPSRKGKKRGEVNRLID